MGHCLTEKFASRCHTDVMECASGASLSYQEISDVSELKRRIKNEWADLNHAIIERVVGE